MFTMLEQVTELNLMIMASSNRKIADLTPLSAPSMTPAVRTKLVVYSEVGVDLRALKGQLGLWVGVHCPSDGHNNRLWPYITVLERLWVKKPQSTLIQNGKVL